MDFIGNQNIPMHVFRENWGKNVQEDGKINRQKKIKSNHHSGLTLWAVEMGISK